MVGLEGRFANRFYGACKTTIVGCTLRTIAYAVNHNSHPRN